VYCSLDKIDLAVEIDGRPVAMQTDDRDAGAMVAEPELTALYAMTRVLNARSQLARDGFPDAPVHYIVTQALTGGVPESLRDALTAVGCTLERSGIGEELLGPTSDDSIAQVIDRSFAALARRTAARIGTHDLAMALRMLEDQTLADPPARDDEAAYWSRVLDLAALAGELLRAKYGGRWTRSEHALVPFGFQLETTSADTVVFPTNRAQRVVEDGPGESLFKLLVAAEETLEAPLDASTGRLMPSLRSDRNVELDEVLWRPLIAELGNTDVPIVVCGIDGESTFGMVRKDAIERPRDEAIDEAIVNLAAEEVTTETVQFGELEVIVVGGSFYASEKLLDVEFMSGLHARLASDVLAVAAPSRGMLLVTAVNDNAAQLARFVALARLQYDDGGGRAISPAVMLVGDGRITGVARREPEPASRADSEFDTPTRPGLFRRLLTRK
jgi:hypothetical protein